MVGDVVESCKVLVQVGLELRLPILHKQQCRGVTAGGWQDPQLAHTAFLCTSDSLLGEPEPDGALVVNAGTEEGEAVALRLADGLDAVEDAGGHRAARARSPLLLQGQREALRAGAGRLHAHGQDARLQCHGDVRGAGHQGAGRDAHAAAPEVGGKGPRRVGGPASRGVPVHGPEVDRVAEGDGRQAPQLRQLRLLHHHGDVARQAQDLQQRELAGEVVERVEGVLQLDGPLVHVLQAQVRNLARPRVLRARPLGSGLNRDVDALSRVPTQHVRAAEDLTALVDLGAEDRIRVVALHVHPEVDPPSPRQRGDKDAAVLPAELGYREEGEALLRYVPELLRGVGVELGVVVGHALLLLLHGDVHVRVDLGRVAAARDEVHEERADLGLPGLAAEAEGALRKVQPDGAVAGVPRAAPEVRRWVVEGRGAAEADDLRGVVEGHPAQGLWVRRGGVLDHHRDITGHHDGGQHDEELGPLAASRTLVGKHQEQVIEGRGLAVGRLQLHSRERVRGLGGQGAIGGGRAKEGLLALRDCLTALRPPLEPHCLDDAVPLSQVDALYLRTVGRHEELYRVRLRPPHAQEPGVGSPVRSFLVLPKHDLLLAPTQHLNAAHAVGRLGERVRHALSLMELPQLEEHVHQLGARVHDDGYLAIPETGGARGAPEAHARDSTLKR
mmetsp:Transcript_14119/g.44368  ORF Transcript_14119/g.44368 Transcript_14119/m.44368 type:complete len:671 (+) Transcript_14119:1186-3198(+)